MNDSILNFFNIGSPQQPKPVEKKILEGTEAAHTTSGSSSDESTMEDNLKKHENQNNTLGDVARGFSSISGMVVSGFGKALGGASMGAVGATTGLFALAGAGLAYGGTRLAGKGHEEAKRHAATGAQAAGFSAAMATSILVSPISLTAKCIEGLGKILINKETKSYQKFDKAFTTSAFVLASEIKKTPVMDAYNKAKEMAKKPANAEQELEVKADTRSTVEGEEGDGAKSGEDAPVSYGRQILFPESEGEVAKKNPLSEKLLTISDSLKVMEFFEIKGEDYIARADSDKGKTTITIQRGKEYFQDDSQNQQIKIEINKKNGSIASVSINGKKQDSIPPEQMKWIETLHQKLHSEKSSESTSSDFISTETSSYESTSISESEAIYPLPMDTLKALRAVNSSKLVDLGADIHGRQDFKDEGWQAPPALLSYSEKILPQPIIARLMHEKKDYAFNTKYVGDGGNGWLDKTKRDKITNMEGALHTFLNPIGSIKMVGDKAWMGERNGVFGNNFGNNQGRDVVLSALVQPDFENNEVLMKIAEIQEESIPGKPLDENYQFPDQGEAWDSADGNKKREKYDEDLQKHMIHHLSAENRLPSISEVKIMNWNEGQSHLESLIDGKKTREAIVNDLKDKAVNLNGRVISLEVMFNVYLQQVHNEMRVLEDTLQQGYVYTMDPPSIFLSTLGTAQDAGKVFNRLQALAFQCVNQEIPLNNLRVIGFASFSDPGMISQLQKALPGKTVAHKADLFNQTKEDNTYLGKDNPLKNLCQGAALVIHNNSDGFAQNVEHEQTGVDENGNNQGSLDAVIGENSTAYEIVSRERTDYHITGKMGGYEPLYK